MITEYLTSYIVLKETVYDYQHIYSSQKLRTFHSIYAKFNIEGNILKNIDFYVKNYKGKGRYGFHGTTVNVIYLNDGHNDNILRIGVKLIPVIGSQKASSEELNINLDDIDNIFVASAHLKINGRDKLPVNEEDLYRDVFVDSIGSNHSDIRDDNQKEFKNLKNKNETALKKWANEEDNRYIHKKEVILEGVKSVARNCRVSLMEVQK